MTPVVNIKHHPDLKNDVNYVYIGRPSKWGNPIPLLHADNDMEREICLRKHRIHVNSKGLAGRNQIRKELQGKVLGCFCKPKGCHGDYLAWIADHTETEWQAVYGAKQ